MARGEIPRTLPFARREAVEVLKASYPSARTRRERSRELREFYRMSAADGLHVAAAGCRKSGQCDRRRIPTQRLPEMNVQFGTYPNNIGHMDFPGCFRCHDDDHKSKDGKASARTARPATRSSNRARCAERDITLTEQRVSIVGVRLGSRGDRGNFRAGLKDSSGA